MVQFGQLVLIASLTAAGSCDALTLCSFAPPSVPQIGTARASIVTTAMPKRMLTCFMAAPSECGLIIVSGNYTAQPISRTNVCCRLASLSLCLTIKERKDEQNTYDHSEVGLWRIATCYLDNSNPVKNSNVTCT